MALSGSRRRSWPLLVAVTAVSALLALAPTAAGADTTAPPTPTGLRAVTTGGDDPADIVLDGEVAGLPGVSASARAWTTSAARRNGERGLRIAASGAPAFARWASGALPQGHQYATARTWVRVLSRAPGESVDLLTVANTRSSRNFDFFVAGDSGRFKWDIYRDRADQSSFVVTPGRWYLVEVRVSYRGTTHTAEVRIDGVPQGLLTSPGTNTSVGSVTVGSTTAKTHTQDYDDLAVRVGDRALGWLGEAPAGRPAAVELTWSPVTDVGSGLREYQIWRDGRWYDWVPAGTTTYTDSDPALGARYQVRAVDHHGNRSGWSPRTTVAGPDSDASPPPTPAGLTARAQPDGSTRLTWSPVVDTGGSGLREYAISRDGRWYGWVPADATTFVDHRPVPGATYRVRAYDRALNRSAWSAPVGP